MLETKYTNNCSYIMTENMNMLKVYVAPILEKSDLL